MSRGLDSGEHTGSLIADDLAQFVERVSAKGMTAIIIEGASQSGEAAPAQPPASLSLEENERRLIREALARTGGNQTQAAKLLCVTRDTLRYKMKKHALHQT